MKELAGLWGLSAKTVARLFADEAGVIRVTNDLRGKRKYATLSIPESVVSRVHARLDTLVREHTESRTPSVRIIRLADIDARPARDESTVIKASGRSGRRAPPERRIESQSQDTIGR